MAITRHLIVEERGAFIGKHQGRLRVSSQGQTLADAPIMHLEAVLLTGKSISISTDALLACCEAGIPIHVINPMGRAVGSVYASGLNGTIRTRRQQLAAYHDQRALQVARALASAKLQNQAGLLRYMAKYRKEADPDRYLAIRDAMTEVLVHESHLERLVRAFTHIDDLREPLMVLEAHAAQHYWRGFSALLPDEHVPFGRGGRGSREAVNSLLNYAYAILETQVERAIVLAGLDPYGGFIHADRAGKPSLVLDLIEPFRQPVVDRAVLNFLGKGGKVEQDEKGWLSATTKREIAERVLDRLERPTLHDGKQAPLRHLIQQQARSLATFVRGDRASFDPFIARW
jgi:CRISPR-associated protein Cas1